MINQMISSKMKSSFWERGRGGGGFGGAGCVGDDRPRGGERALGGRERPRRGRRPLPGGLRGLRGADFLGLSILERKTNIF